MNNETLLVKIRNILKYIPDLDKIQAKFYGILMGKKTGTLMDCMKIYNVIQSMESLVALEGISDIRNELNEQIE